MSSRESSPSSNSDTSETQKSADKHTPARDIVMTKYNMAAAVTNAVLQEIIKKCLPGQSVIELCEYGDQMITEKTSQLFKKEKDMKKGIAFPTCISINHYVCHFSPLKSEKDLKLANGDIVKIDLGAHVDGYIAVAAHTVVAQDVPFKIIGRKADAILAAHYALEAAIRMLRPGQHENFEITEMIQKIAEAYHCKPVENMLSHQLLRNKIDGEKQIILNPGEKQRQDMEKCKFEQYEVFALDILISTGDGKTKDADARTTVYMKNDEIVYQLKVKTSRAWFFEAEKRFQSLPFTLRAFDEEAKAKMGVVECERHNLMKPFPVLFERDGEFVAQMKATVLIMPNGLFKIAGPGVGGCTFDASLYESEYKIEDEKILQLLQSSLKPAKKKAKKNNLPPGLGDMIESHLTAVAEKPKTEQGQKQRSEVKEGQHKKKNEGAVDKNDHLKLEEDVKKLALNESAPKKDSKKKKAA